MTPHTLLVQAESNPEGADLREEGREGGREGGRGGCGGYESQGEVCMHVGKMRVCGKYRKHVLDMDVECGGYMGVRVRYGCM